MAFNSQRQKAYLALPCLPRTATNASQTEWVTATPPALKSRRNLKRLWSSHALWTCLGKNKLGYLSDRRADLKWWFCRWWWYTLNICFQPDFADIRNMPRISAIAPLLSQLSSDVCLGLSFPWKQIIPSAFMCHANRRAAFPNITHC